MLGDVYMGKYTIEYEREGCIGAGACVDACPSNWSMNDDGKADLKVAEIDEAQLEENKAAAEGCPVNVIHIINKETGERLI